VSIAETTCDSSMITRTRYAESGFRLLSLHGKAFRRRTLVIAAIASGVVSVITLYEGRVNGSTVLDSTSSRHFSYHSCFIVDNISFHKSSIEFDGVRLLVHRSEHSMQRALEKPEIVTDRQ